jgi:hypothetical protein
MPDHTLDYASINRATLTLLAAGFSVIPADVDKRPVREKENPFTGQGSGAQINIHSEFSEGFAEDFEEGYAIETKGYSSRPWINNVIEGKKPHMVALPVAPKRVANVAE